MADHHEASGAATAAGARGLSLSWDQRELGPAEALAGGGGAAKVRSASPGSHCTIRWVLRPGSKTFLASTHEVPSPTSNQSGSRLERRPTCVTTFVASPGRYGAQNPAGEPLGPKALESHPPP